MNAKRVLFSLVIGCLFLTSGFGEVQKKVRIVSLSKVEAAKGRMREKLFTDWMTLTALQEYTAQNKAGKRQILFFEYSGPRDKWRAILTDKVVFNDYSWWALSGQSAIEAKLDEELKEGRHPAFVTQNGIFYAMLTVSPDDFTAARKELAELGIGEPKLK